MPTLTDSDPEEDTQQEEGAVSHYNPEKFADFTPDAIKGKQESNATGGTVHPGSIGSVGAKDKEGLAPSLTGRLPTKDISGKTGDAAAGAMGGLKDTAKGFVPTPEGFVEKKLQDKVQEFMSKNGKKMGVGGGIAAAVISLFVLFGSIALTNELDSIMSTLVDHFFAAATQEMDKETDKLVNHEIQRIMKRLGPDCESSKDECAQKGEETEGEEDNEADPVDELDTTLDDADFAQKLADAGYEFTYEDGKIFLSTPDGQKIDVTKYKDDSSDEDIGDDPQLSAASSEDFEGTVEDEFPSEGSMEHIENADIDAEFGIEDCAMACPQNDENADQPDETPQDQADFAEAEDYEAGSFEAAATADGASDLINPEANDTQNDNFDSTTGSEVSTLDQHVEESAEEVSTVLGSEKLAQLVASANALKDKAASAMVDLAAQAIAKSLSAIPGVDVSSEAVSEIMSDIAEKIAGPVAWIQLFAQVITGLSSLAFKLRLINFLAHELPALFKFAEFAASWAEQRSGGNHVNLAELGSVIHAFSANGSTASQSELFQSVTDPHNTPSDVTSGSISKELSGEHLSLKGYNNALTAASDGFNDIPGSNFIVEVARFANDIIGGALGPITGIISGITDITGLNKLIGLAATAFLKWMISELVSTPNYSDLSGKTAYDVGGEGADLSGNNLAEANGGQVLTTTQSAAIDDQQEQQAMQQFQQQPIFARIFSTDTPYSLVSRLSLEMPWSFSSGFQSTMADLVSNPFSKIFDTVSSIFTSGVVSAATPAQPDPFGIPQYGIPNNDPVYSTDPETYWQQHDCAEQEANNWQSWNSSQNTTTDPNTEQEDHNTTNGCLLIKQAAANAGAVWGYTGS